MKHRPKMKLRGLPSPEEACATLVRATAQLPNAAEAASLAATLPDDEASNRRAAEILRAHSPPLPPAWGEVCLALLELGFRGTWHTPAQDAYSEMCCAALAHLQHLKPAGAMARYAELVMASPGCTTEILDALQGYYVPRCRRSAKKLVQQTKRGLVGKDELPVLMDWFETLTLTHQQGHSARNGVPHTIGIEGDATTLAELRERLADPTRKLHGGHRQVYERAIAELERRVKA